MPAGSLLNQPKLGGVIATETCLHASSDATACPATLPTTDAGNRSGRQRPADRIDKQRAGTGVAGWGAVEHLDPGSRNVRTALKPPITAFDMKFVIQPIRAHPATRKIAPVVSASAAISAAAASLPPPPETPRPWLAQFRNDSRSAGNRNRRSITAISFTLSSPGFQLMPRYPSASRSLGSAPLSKMLWPRRRPSVWHRPTAGLPVRVRRTTKADVARRGIGLVALPRRDPVAHAVGVVAEV